MEVTNRLLRVNSVKQSLLIGIFTVHGVFYQKNVCGNEGILMSKLGTRMGRD